MCCVREPARVPFRVPHRVPHRVVHRVLMMVSEVQVALCLLLLLMVHAVTGASHTVSQAKSILDSWKPSVHGAVAVKVGELPYQASIRLYSPEGNQHRCGGAVISRWHVLTAARCVAFATPLAADSVFVVVGAVRRRALDDGDVETVVRKVYSIAWHPDYRSGDQRHDVAVLTLTKSLPQDKAGIGTIPLPAGDIHVEIGSTCVISGWGNNTAQSPVASDALLSAEVPFIGRELCALMYDPQKLPEGTVCTAHQKGGVGACVGDTGGPLVCGGFLAGSVSWGQGCGQSARPTVFTSMMDHVAWVRLQMMVFPPRALGEPPTRGTWGTETPTSTSGASAALTASRALGWTIAAAVLGRRLATPV